MKKQPLRLKGILTILKSAFIGFGDDKVIKLSGSLAYSTVFSLAPLFIVVISLCGVFFGKEAVEGGIYHQLQNFVGKDVAIQLQEIIKNTSLSGKSKVGVIVGSIILFIGATAIFTEIQDSINSIWGIKPKSKKGLLKLIQNRFLSFSLVVGLGFLLLVSLTVNGLVDAFNSKLQSFFPDVALILFQVINILITFIIVSLIFGIIFKVLPDAQIKWKDIRAGAFTTALLFMLGKFAITFYISKSNVGSTYGTAGSIIILLMWVYYSSIILYFGAEFTKAYALKYGSEIKPNQYAITTKTIEVDTSDNSIQQNEKIINTIKS